MSGIRRRLVGAAGTWVAVLAVVGVAVHPERCPPVDAAAARRAAVAAVGWFGASIDDSGKFLYGYDADTGVELGGYNDPRHAGVLFSLYQAEAAGIDGAAAIADRGLAYVDRHTRRAGPGAVFGRGRQVPTGATALLVIALDERQRATGDASRDDDLRAYGRALLATVTAQGAVEATIDAEAGTGTGTRSPFATGQVAYALARLQQRFPGERYGAAAVRILSYLVAARDDTEDQFPMLSDHWASYGLVAMNRWKSPPVLDGATRDWIERQFGLFGVQVRYESQRRGGLTVFTRGRTAMASGVGTVGEGLANLARVAATDPVLDVDDVAVGHRLACVAGMLVERQTLSPDPFPRADPVAVTGAWFRLGVTRMDDQQHPLSALILLQHYLREP